MKIAVAYDNGSGNVFQHFGKSENFKVYEVEDSKVVNSEVIGFVHSLFVEIEIISFGFKETFRNLRIFDK